MHRPPRNFRAESFELEARLLLTIAPTSHVDVESAIAYLQPTTYLIPLQVVTQQAGEATVTLSRSDTAGSLQVEVKTEPSKFVGVNVGAVDQTVTFADGQGQASLTVPILSGARNPGAVDVYLDLSYPDSSANHGPALLPRMDLRIVASDPTVPPKVVYIVVADVGIRLYFNKPMNPIGASDVNNYALSYALYYNHHTNNNFLFGAFGHNVTTVKVKYTHIQSAHYDPATQSVLLFPEGWQVYYYLPSVSQVHPARPSARPGHHSNVAQGLTDLQGKPVNVHTTPGKVGLREVYQTLGY